jgi:hypothetical protein
MFSEPASRSTRCGSIYLPETEIYERRLERIF